MLRKVMLGGGAVALAVGVMAGVGAGVASAVPPPINFAGTATCTAYGSVHFGTPATNTGTGSTSVTVKAKLQSCSAPVVSGATLVSGNLSLTGTTTPNCGPLLSGSPMALSGQIKWKASGGKAATSTVTVSGGSLLYDLTYDSIDVNLPTSVSAGSFAGETGTFGDSAALTPFLLSSKSGTVLQGRCPGNGLKAVPFGKPAGSLSGTVTIAGV